MNLAGEVGNTSGWRCIVKGDQEIHPIFYFSDTQYEEEILEDDVVDVSFQIQMIFAVTMCHFLMIVFTI